MLRRLYRSAEPASTAGRPQGLPADGPAVADDLMVYLSGVQWKVGKQYSCCKLRQL